MQLTVLFGGRRIGSIRGLADLAHEVKPPAPKPDNLVDSMFFPRRSHSTTLVFFYWPTA